MTKGDLKAETARRLAEVNGRVFFTDVEIDAAVELGYQEISDETEWCEANQDIALLTDQWYYDLWTILGPGFLCPRPAFNRDTNRWLIPSTVRQLDAHDRRWERVVGTPQRFFTRSLRWLGYYPRVQVDVGTIKQYFIKLPDPLGTDDAVPGFPATFHYGIVNFALTDLWAQDGETALALGEWQAYLEVEAALALWVQNRAADAMRRGFLSSPTVSIQR